MSTHLLERLRAETLLHDQLILSQITTLKTGMNYKSDDEVYSLSDFFELLRKDASNLSQVQLTSSVASGTEQSYLVQLLTSYESVLDEVERQIVRAIFFAGKLKNLRQRVDSLQATFIAWYLIALADQVKDVPSLKLTANIQKSLAESEFSRLLDGADQDLEGMLEATSLMVDMLKGHKKLAAEKYNMGKDQVNASLSSLATDGYLSDGAPRFTRKARAVEEDEDEEVIPRFTSKDKPVPMPTLDPDLEPGEENPHEGRETAAILNESKPTIVASGVIHISVTETTTNGISVATKVVEDDAAPFAEDVDLEAEAQRDLDKLAEHSVDEEALADLGSDPQEEVELRRPLVDDAGPDEFEDEDVTSGTDDSGDAFEPEPDSAAFEEDEEVTEPFVPKVKKLDPAPVVAAGEVDAADLKKQKLSRTVADEDDEDFTAPPTKKPTTSKKTEVNEAATTTTSTPPTPRKEEKIPTLFQPRRPAPKKSFADDDDLDGVM